MKKIIFLIMLSVFCNAIKAQVFSGGVILGINASQVDGDDYSGYNKAGLSLGVLVGILDDRKFGFETGLMFNQKGAKEEENGITLWKTNFNYIELPILLKYRFLPRFSLDFGYSFGVLSGCKFIDEYGYETKDSDQIRKIDNNLLLMLDFQLIRSFEIRIKYQYSITSVSNPDYDLPNWRHNVIGVGIIKRF